jgi:hypothetical protein
VLTVLTGLTVGMVLTLAILLAVDEAPGAGARSQALERSGDRRR